MAAAKKNTSASSHQRDLARMSGNTAARNKAAAMKKAGQRMGVLDATGSAAVRAERKALKSFGLKTEPGKTTKKAAAKPSTVQQVAKRFGVTAREARDIATAVGSLAKSAQVDAKMNSKRGGKNTLYFTKPALGNLGNQIKETVRAGATGKKGSDSMQIKTGARGGTGVTHSYSRDKSKNAPGRTAADEIKGFLKTEKKLKKQGK